MIRTNPARCRLKESGAASVLMVTFAAMRPLLLAAAVLLLPGASCHRDSARPPAAGPQARPQTEADCRGCKGIWGPQGINQTTMCVCRTSDAGKECRDGLDCQGECVAVDGRTEITDPGPPARGYFLGACSEFDLMFGCRKLLPDGTRARGPATLDEAPAELCLD